MTTSVRVQTSLPFNLCSNSIGLTLATWFALSGAIATIRFKG